jgi:hypothetical protein
MRLLTLFARILPSASRRPSSASSSSPLLTAHRDSCPQRRPASISESTVTAFGYLPIR